MHPVQVSRLQGKETAWKRIYWRVAEACGALERHEVREARALSARRANLTKGVVQFIPADPKFAPKGRLALVWGPDNQRMLMKHLPWCPRLKESPSDYNCPISVALYMRFLFEGAAVLMIMFCLTAVSLNDNLARNNFRAACRQAATVASQYDALVYGRDFVNDTVWANTVSALGEGYSPEDCGYFNRSIRQFFRVSQEMEDDVSASYQSTSSIFFPRGGLGGCSEYNNASSDLSALQNPNPMEAMTVNTPDAKYCLTETAWSRANHWCELLAMVLFLAFLARVRYLTQQAARDEDQGKLTAADYSLHLSGLSKKIEPNELKERLWVSQGECESGTAEGGWGVALSCVDQTSLWRS